MPPAGCGRTSVAGEKRLSTGEQPERAGGVQKSTTRQARPRCGGQSVVQCISHWIQRCDATSAHARPAVWRQHAGPALPPTGGLRTESRHKGAGEPHDGTGSRYAGSATAVRERRGTTQTPAAWRVLVGAQALGGGASGWYARSSSRPGEGESGSVGVLATGMMTATADGLIAVVQCAAIAQPLSSDDDWDCDGQPWDAQCPSVRPVSFMAPSSAISTALAPLVRSASRTWAAPECTPGWLPVAIAPLSWLDIAPHATCVHPIELRRTLRASRRAPRRRARGTEAADGGIIVEECNRRTVSRRRQPLRSRIRARARTRAAAMPPCYSQLLSWLDSQLAQVLPDEKAALRRVSRRHRA